MTEFVPDNAIEKHQPQQLAAQVQSDPMALIAAAIERGYSPEALNALVDLKHKMDDRAARMAFNAALVEFRRSAPVVVKSRTADFSGKAAYKFASIDDIENAISDSLAAAGFAYSFPEGVTGDRDGWIRVTCRLTHVAGHCESTAIDLPIPSEMRVNATQKGGAALSYGRRYALCMVLGLRIVGEDNDAGNLHATSEATQAAMECVTDQQAIKIEEMIEYAQADRSRFFAWASTQAKRKITMSGEIPASMYDQAITMLKAKATKK